MKYAALYRVIEVRARSGQTKDYAVDMCGFPAKHTAVSSKSKNWLAWNQNNVSEWSNMSIRVLL